MAKEKNLTTVTSVAAADFARLVTSAGASVKATAANLAKYIIETYNGSTVAGSAQSVKSALDSLNSNTEYIHSTGISLDAQSAIRDAIVSSYNSATANPTQLQLAFAQVSGVGRFVILIHKNSANYGSALAFGYGSIGKLYSITCSGGTLGTLKQVSFTDV